MLDLKDRKRFVDVANLTPEQRAELQDRLNNEVARVVNNAEAELNEILSIYGIMFKMVVVIDKKDVISKS